MECIINRRAQFSASHRYWLPELGEAQNVGKFGRVRNFPDTSTTWHNSKNANSTN
jgi:6-pyruvoyltetrahydropterin/6-carboxytetrahydropterin synthase